MIKISDNIVERENKLLKKESYFRKARYIYFISGIFILLVAIISAFKHSIGNDFSETPFWLFILCIVIGYETHLQVRHIESIKYYRSKCKDHKKDN